MTQPNPGDYVALEPKTSTPGASTPGTADHDDNGVAVHGTSIVQMQEQAWRRRAEAASAAAEELRRCASAAATVLRHNYFGDGCVEGADLYEALCSALTSQSGWLGDLRKQATTLDMLASTCVASGAALASEDRRSANGIDAVAT